jgi:hypothetical protein
MEAYNKSGSSPQSVRKGSVWFSKQTAIDFLNVANILIFVTKIPCIFLEVEAEFLNVIVFFARSTLHQHIMRRSCLSVRPHISFLKLLNGFQIRLPLSINTKSYRENLCTCRVEA